MSRESKSEQHGASLSSSPSSDFSSSDSAQREFAPNPQDAPRKSTSDPKNIDEALAKFSAIAPRVLKTKSSQSGPRVYKYSPLDEILETIRPYLAECNLMVKFSAACRGLDLSTSRAADLALSIAQKQAGVSLDSKDSRRTFDSLVNAASMATIDVTTEIVYVPNSTSISLTLSAAYVANDPQDIGIKMTYLRRYGLVALLALAADEDTDGVRVNGTSQRASSTQIGELLAAAARARVSQEKILSVAGVARIEDIPADEIVGYIAKLNERAAKQAAEASNASND